MRSKSGKSVSEEDKKLFRTMVEQTRPGVMRKSGPAKPLKKSGPGGLDGGTQEKLKRGAMAPQARLDLHGMTQGAAHGALLGFLQRSHRMGHRLTLVITGQGNPKYEDEADWMRRPHGVLKDMVPRWLREPEFAEVIAQVQHAHIRHGGDGALYVYLRKPR